MILLADVERGNTRSELVSRRENQRQVNVLGLVGSQAVVDLQHLGVADHLVDSPESQSSHDGTELVGDVIEEVDHVLGRTGELLAKLRILRGNAYRAGVLFICQFRYIMTFKNKIIGIWEYSIMRT